MSKINKLTTSLIVILSFCSLAVFASITYALFCPERTYIIVYYEKEAYLLCGVCYLLILHRINQHVKSFGKKFLICLSCCTVCTLQVWLLNNLFHYIVFNTMFDWVDPAPYSMFLINDLCYTQNGQIFKYPFVFIFLLFACIMDIIVFSKLTPKFKSK